MTNALGELLKTGTLTRRVQAYEATFDDFIAFAGGKRVTDLVDIPQNAANADYVVEFEDARLIVELKQVSKYDATNSVEDYFSGLLARGKVLNPTFIAPRRMTIEPASLSVTDWTRFYRKFRPRIPESLDKAAKQIKATPKLLALTDKRSIGIAILLNTGDYNLPIDLLFRIVERHTKAKWKAGRFSTLDGVLCLCMDMIKAGQHPLQGHMIVRDAADAAVANSVHYLYDRWIHYGAAALGAEVEFTPGPVDPDPLQLSGAVTGKIRLIP